MERIMPFCCVHIGAREFNEEALRRHLRYAVAMDAKVVLLGDTIDNQVYSGTRHQGTVYEAKESPDEQIDHAVSILKGIGNRIVAHVGGNHCERTKKASGIHPEKVISDRLGVPFHPAVYTANLGGRNFLFTHGMGTTDTDFNKALLAYENVDIICIGHNHQLSHKITKRLRVFNGKEYEKEINLVRCGSFLRYPEYARRALYQPSPSGCPVVEINKGTVNVRLGI